MRGGRVWRYLAVAIVMVGVPVGLVPLDSVGNAWWLALGIGTSYAVMAMSLNILMGYAGQISLGHGGLIAAGAYTSGLVTGRASFPFAVGVIAAAAMGGIFAFIIGLPALRLRGLYLAITTVGFVIAMEQSILQIRGISRGSAGVALPRPEVGSFVFTENGYYLALALVLALGIWILDANLVQSRFGRGFRGLREDEEVAASYGVDVRRFKLLAFVLSGAVAGISGAIHGHLIGFVTNTVFGLQFSLLLVAWVIIGGLGSRSGVVISAALFGFFPEVLERVFAIDFLSRFQFVAGAALLLVVIVRNPDGIAGDIRHRREQREMKEAKKRLGQVDDDDVPVLPEFPQPQRSELDLRLGDPVLEVTDVTVRFGGLVAVNDAFVQVRKGMIVGLIGPNGAGKTTLFNAIGGFAAPERAEVRLLGERIDHLPAHDRAAKGLGRTFQRGGLADNLTMLDNLSLAQHVSTTYDIVSALARNRAVRRQEQIVADRSREVIHALGLEPLAELPVKHLSGGQRRIVEMACALVTSPALLMLDEPSAGMAPAAVESLASRLLQLRDDYEQTVLLIEHHVPLVLDVCDIVYVLDHGDVIAAGEPNEVMANPLVLEAYLGGPASELVEAVA